METQHRNSTPCRLPRLAFGLALAAALISPAAVAGQGQGQGQGGKMPIPVKGTSAQMKGTAASAGSQQPQTDRLIVRFKSISPQTATGRLAPAAQALGQRVGIALTHLRATASGAQVVKLPKKVPVKEAEAIAARLAKDPAVASVRPDHILRKQMEPNDTLYPSQWHYYEPVGGINLPAALDISLGAGTVVAVLDTGVRPHADLVANLLPGYDMVSDVDNARDGNGRDTDPSDPGDWQAANECGEGDPAEAVSSSWHGTHVAGTIAALTNNGDGVASVAPAALLLPVRVLGKCGGYTSDILDAVVWAAGGEVPDTPPNPTPAQVINLSLGGYAACDPDTQQVFDQARSLGATVVVSAGNGGANAEEFFPGNCANVVTVAATNRAGSRSYYSNSGANVTLAAPGGDLSNAEADGVLSTLNSGTQGPGEDSYVYYHGTSMAAPHVAGVAALLKATAPELTPDDVVTLLTGTARPFPGFCDQCGAGIVDAGAALTGEPSAPPDVVELENGVPVTGLSGGPGSVRRFTLEVPAGTRNLRFALAGEEGDADLYVKRGSPPTQEDFDCRPFTGSSNETCEWESAEPGTWHVLVHAFGQYANASLVGSYEAAETGFTQQALGGGFFSWRRESIDVPDGAQRLLVNISGGSGDADLYLRHDRSPTLWSFDCASRGDGNDASCSIEAPASGNWRIGMFTLFGYSDVTLRVRVLH